MYVLCSRGAVEINRTVWQKCSPMFSNGTHRFTYVFDHHLCFLYKLGYLSCHQKNMLTDIEGVVLLLIRIRKKVFYWYLLSHIIHIMISYCSSSWIIITRFSLTKWRRYQSGIKILPLGGGGVHSEELAGHLRKLYPNVSGGLDLFAFVRCYVD